MAIRNLRYDGDPILRKISKEVILLSVLVTLVNVQKPKALIYSLGN